MRTTGLPCRRALCVCLVVVATITAAERGNRATQVLAPTRGGLHVPTSNQAPANLMDFVSPLPRGHKVIRDVIVAGGAHEPAPDGGSTAGTGVKVYSNTLGPSAFGPSGNGGFRIADDIATTGLAGCALDRYVIRVTGDKNGTGDTRPLTVIAALYDSCPGAVAVPTPIANTVCITQFADGSVHDVVCTIPALTTIPVPSTLYVAVTFDRGNAGWIVGAPAEQGFSADRFDFPGFACAAALGGFPELPHASFYTQIFVRACGSAFPAYRNTKQSGSAFTPGRLIRFGDDITLTRSDCRMTGYVVSVKGTCSTCSGAFLVDLKTSLSNSNPESGNRIPGTAQTEFVFTNEVQVFPFDFDPPIELTGSSLFITFATGSDVVGPVVTGRRADIGNTIDAYVEYRGTAPTGEWVFQDFGARTWSAFDVTVFCEGDPPAGACCDMFLVDENGDSVCRDLPEINCASSQTAPSLWQEGKQCGATDLGEPALCQGGDNNGAACTRQVDCPGGDCPGPFQRACGLSACCTFDDRCLTVTENECTAEPSVLDPRQFQRGSYCGISGQRCPKGACLASEGGCGVGGGDTFCLFGQNAGETCAPSTPHCSGVCLGGSNAGASCLGSGNCFDGGQCAQRACDAGSRVEQPCIDNDDCPDGRCLLDNCRGFPGCEDPLCCTAVCTLDSSCCETHWDAQCAAATIDLPECQVTRCGNGVVEGTEECDDIVESAMCDADCTVAECGDGTGNVTAGEQCDEGGESAICDADCTVAQCGDGTLNVTAGEDCDGGLGCTDCLCSANFEPTTPPSVDCQPTCGNGTVDPGEGCDGGGESATCDADCTVAECGDGTLNVTRGEECDDGGESATCDADCTMALCEDGTLNVAAGEACDGMNDTACPGACLSDCTCGLFCGDGVCDPEETSCNCPSDCGTPPASETPGSTCSDGLDNDCDGLIDFDDPDCGDEPIPSVSGWGLIVMALLLLTGIKVTFGRRNALWG